MQSFTLQTMIWFLYPPHRAHIRVIFISKYGKSSYARALDEMMITGHYFGVHGGVKCYRKYIYLENVGATSKLQEQDKRLLAPTDMPRSWIATRGVQRTNIHGKIHSTKSHSSELAGSLITDKTDPD